MGRLEHVTHCSSAPGLLGARQSSLPRSDRGEGVCAVLPRSSCGSVDGSTSS